MLEHTSFILGGWSIHGIFIHLVVKIQHHIDCHREPVVIVCGCEKLDYLCFDLILKIRLESQFSRLFKNNVNIVLIGDKRNTVRICNKYVIFFKSRNAHLYDMGYTAYLIVGKYGIFFEIYRYGCCGIRLISSYYGILRLRDVKSHSCPLNRLKRCDYCGKPVLKRHFRVIVLFGLRCEHSHIGCIYIISELALGIALLRKRHSQLILSTLRNGYRSALYGVFIARIINDSRYFRRFIYIKILKKDNIILAVQQHRSYYRNYNGSREQRNINYFIFLFLTAPELPEGIQKLVHLFLWCCHNLYDSPL